MAQQTAVEWLFVELTSTWYDVKSSQDLLEQAKEMEKEQRIRDYNAGYADAQCNHINDAENYVSESEYLNNNLKIN
jgi:hypothetical protein